MLKLDKLLQNFQIIVNLKILLSNQFMINVAIFQKTIKANSQELNYN